MLTILATGRTYVLELESKAVARNGLLTAGGLISAGLPTNSSGVPAPQPDPVLKWDTLVLTVGSDPQAIVAPHTHDYRTGRGSGHNRLEAESSLPN